jgi:hypothetical protein
MSSEDHRERRATEAVGRVLERTLRRYEDEPDGDDSLDYIDDENEAYEMKSVTPEEYEELRAQRSRWHGSRQLAMQWSILLRAPTMDDKFRPMPDFPEDDAATITAIEADGVFRVTRKEEREAEWTARYSGSRVPIARIRKREAKLLEQNLLVLEQAGLTDTRGAVRLRDEERRAIAEVHRLTRGAICMARPAPPGGGGIRIKVGWGYIRENDPNVLAFRVQRWLDSPLGANLAYSLRQSRFARRHGVLTFESSEPEYWSAAEAGLAFVPTVHLTLPPEIDVLWCLIGPVLLCYDPEQGWRSFDAVSDMAPVKPSSTSESASPVRSTTRMRTR